MWSRYFWSEAITEEQVKDDLRRSTYIRPSTAEEWDNKIAKTEERYQSAKHFAANQVEFAEKSQDHTEKLGWVRDAEDIIEIHPQYKVTWGSAVR